MPVRSPGRAQMRQAITGVIFFIFWEGQMNGRTGALVNLGGLREIEEYGMMDCVLLTPTSMSISSSSS